MKTIAPDGAIFAPLEVSAGVNSVVHPVILCSSLFTSISAAVITNNARGTITGGEESPLLFHSRARRM